MPKLPADWIPKYQLHKSSGHAVVEFPGEKSVYLGPHGSEASYEKYNRLVGEWIARGRRPKPEPLPEDHGVLYLVELANQYREEYVKKYYVKNGNRQAREVVPGQEPLAREVAVTLQRDAHRDEENDMPAFKAMVSICVVVAMFAGTAPAVSIATVPVGNPGNAGDMRYPPYPVPPNFVGYGAVGYTYQIGKFDVTAGQYCEFLSAVAKTDTYGLYSKYMEYDAYPSLRGCNIKREGTPGNYAYTVGSDWANRPVNDVSWGDAARFCNWLTNGQPTGLQGLDTTEDGSYYLNGAITDAALMTASRKTNARYVLPTEDEWHKAAYYDESKPGGAGYWDYPTRSNTVPANVLDPTGINNANYGNGSNNYVVGPPYYRTEVGAFANSPGAYGTLDEGGNVWQWNETVRYNSMRGVLGGSFWSYPYDLRAGTRSYSVPTHEQGDWGFRVALVPEPATITLLAVSGLAVIRKRRFSPA